MSIKFQIICTLGPSVEGRITDLMSSGATAFRLNCSHLTQENVSRWLVNIEKAFKKMGVMRPVWLDLQGAKTRIGKLLRSVLLKKNDLVHFVNCYSQLDDGIPLPHQKIFDSVQEGDEFFLNDGKIRLQVERLEENRFYGRVMNDGELDSFKGFHLDGLESGLKEIFTRDLAFMEQTKHYANIGYALSYIQTADEVELFRARALDRPLAAKIERAGAFDELREIAEMSDCLWLCRGDLGATTNIYHLFHYEKLFIQRLELIEKPFFIAGQVLENMIGNSYPSRSEISHLGYLIENGFTGVILSDETAIGKYPIQAVEFCRDYFNYLAS